MLSNIGGYRGLKTNSMSKMSQDFELVPVVGSVSCGPMLLAEQNIEYYVPIPKSQIGNGKHYILTANGNSMINAGINDGDKVLIRIQSTAEEGQIVVARVDDEATLKRYYIDREKQKVRLHPENNRMKDIYVDNIEIQGIAITVTKSLI